MKKKLLILSIIPFLFACAKNNTLNYDDSIYHVSNDSYLYNEDEFLEEISNTDYNYDITFELSENGSYYIVSDKNFTLNTSILNIPPLYNGKEVREIKSEGFVEKKWLETIILPKTIQKIGDGAFSLCGLKKIIYDCESVCDFNARNWVFYPDTSINNEIEVIFGNNVKTIPNRLFYPLSTSPFLLPNIKSIKFVENSNLTSIGDYAFYKVNIDNISLPSTLSRIGDYAFYQVDINELRLPSSLSYVGNFSFCSSNISNIRFNDELTYIGDYAFYNNKELNSIDLSNTKVNYIGEFAFNKCSNVSLLKLSSNDIEIHSNAFSNLTNLMTLDLSNASLTLYKEAFANNIKIKNLKIGKLTLKESDCFINLKGLENLSIVDNFVFEYENTYSIFSFSGNENGLNIFINNVNDISNYLFYFNNDNDNQININNLYLSDTLTNISNDAFLNTHIDVIYYVGNKSSFKKLNFNNYEKINYYSSIEINNVED